MLELGKLIERLVGATNSCGGQSRCQKIGPSWIGRRASKVRCAAKPCLGNTTERIFFQKLRVAMCERYVVWPRPRLSDILTVTDAPQNFDMVQAMNETSVPFVICNPLEMRPRLVVGYDDHNADPCSFEPARIVERVLQSAGISTIRFSTSHELSEIEILAAVKCALEPHLRIDNHGSSVQVTHIAINEPNTVQPMVPSPHPTAARA